MPTTSDDTSALTVLLGDEAEAAGFPTEWPENVRVCQIGEWDTGKSWDLHRLLVVTSATCLHAVAPLVTAANRANRLQALLVRSDVDPTWVPFMFEHARLRVLRNLIVHSSASLPSRVVNAWAQGEQHDIIADATVIGDELIVRSCALEVHRIQFNAYPALDRISPEDRSSFVIEEDGLFLHWPVADVHLDLEAVRDANDPDHLTKLRARKLAEEEAFGAAVRALREELELTQAEVSRRAGLSERQVRRIESGDTTRDETLDLLARAHDMSPNEYLNALSDRMSDLVEDNYAVSSGEPAKPLSVRGVIGNVRLSSSRGTMAHSGRTVSRREDGSWANKKDGAERASSLHSTQAQAVNAARTQLRHTGGGELKVKNEAGKIRSKDTIAPAHDPRRTRG
jgi:DNA-binding transcriptional regulator YiaG